MQGAMKSGTEGTRTWWKNRMFDRRHDLTRKSRSWTSPCCGHVFFHPSAASRVKNTVTFIAHTGRYGRKKIPSVRFSIRYIYTLRHALIFILSNCYIIIEIPIWHQVYRYTFIVIKFCINLFKIFRNVKDSANFFVILIEEKRLVSKEIGLKG